MEQNRRVANLAIQAVQVGFDTVSIEIFSAPPQFLRPTRF